MDNKLQVLTEKLYNEGLLKGQEEAERIVADAKQKADEIIKQAKQNADKLLKESQQTAETLKKSVENELKMAAKNTQLTLRKQIEDLVITKVLSDQTQKTLWDATYVKDVIKIAVTQWNANSTSPQSLEVTLPGEKQKEFEKVFSEAALKELGNVEIVYNKTTKSGFKIGEKGGSYKLSFGDEDFDSLFKSFIKPKLNTLLFGQL